MKKLILFAGLPGVGKSTVSKAVSKKTGAKIIDIDDFKKIDVDPVLVTNQIDPPEQRWAYYNKALDHAFDLFGQEISIILMDEVFHLNSLRAQLEDRCTKQNVQVTWIEVRCSYGTVEKRLRSTKREWHILSTEEALRMYLLFVGIFEKFSAFSQNHIVVNNENDVDMELLVENILKK